MKDFISQIKAGAKVLVIFNGNMRHLQPDAEYHEMLEALAARHDLNLTLVMPGDWAHEYIAEVVGVDVRALEWRVVNNSLVSHWPNHLLVEESGDLSKYSGLGFDHNSMFAVFKPAAAQHLWRHFEPYSR